MVLKDLPIKEGINLAGSICSIVAVLMAFSISFNVYQWMVIIIGLIFGICIFGLILSVANYISKSWKWIIRFNNNPFGFLSYWFVIVLAGLFLSFMSGIIFGGITEAFFQLVEDFINDLPNLVRI